MKFLIYSSSDVMDSSATGVANALERLGHGVSRFQRVAHPRSFPMAPIINCANLYKIDCFVFCGGPEVLSQDIQMLRTNFPKAIFIMWNWDVMTNGDTWKWFEPLARACDLCIQMDDSKPDEWAGINRIFCHMGIDPAVEKPFEGEITAADHAKYDADVAFMGMSYEFGGRKRTIDLVKNWCEQNGKTFKVWGLWTEYLIGDELAKMIACTKVHLGHEPEGRPANHWSQRVYTVLAHGGFYLAKWVEGYEQEFSRDFLRYWQTEEQLLGLLNGALKIPDGLKMIGMNGSRYVRGWKRWDDRVASVLPTIQATLDRRRA
jgi:hypothetical protein